MRVRGDLPPSGAYTLEEQPKKPGFVLARFYENVEPFEESGYIYDEYHLELPDYERLGEDIENNYAGYLAQAKQQEEEQNLIPKLRQQVADLETENAALTEQLAEQDDAIIELYEKIGG